MVADEAALVRLAAAWACKWDGRWRYRMVGGAFHHQDGGHAQVYRMVPVKVLAFGKGRLGHTRHRL